jgi:AcrR family transcriptional regulator
MSTPERTRSPVAPFSGSTCDEASCARDRIFEAARNLFYQYGIRGVSVDQIAAEASTTKVTLYRVFESKDDLVLQVLEDHRKRFWEWWESVVAPFEGDPRKQIAALFESLSDKVRAGECERGCPVVNIAVEIVDDDHPAKRSIHDHNDEIASRLRELCRQMGTRQPEELAASLTLLLIGVFTSRMVFNNVKSVGSVSRAAAALLDSAMGDGDPGT